MTFLKHCKTGLLAFWPAPKNHGKSGLHHEHVAPHEKTERRGMSFPIPRPRGKDMPSATPRGRARSKAPMQGAIPPPTKSMDSTGRFTVSVVSPPHFGTGSVPSQPVDALEKATLMALRHARDDRSNPLGRKEAAA